MAIREDLVASAAKFLQDPSVSSSPPESRVAFLKAKNLTPEEISASLARAGLEPAPGYPVPPPPGASPLVAHPGQAQPPYFAQQPPYGQYPPYGWQPPPEIPRRDWRDWFIMATMVGGVGYGLYTITKRYVYPLVSPPTPDRLEQDKKAIDEQFDRAFALVEQLAKDTDELKAAEKDRTERLDAALSNLESVLTDLKSANKRREDDAERLRDDVKGLKDALPKALDAQKDVTDGRLREVNTELKGLKTLISQRMAPAPAPAASVNGTNIARIGSSFPVVSSGSTGAPSVASVESEKTADKTVATPATTSTATTVTAVPNTTPAVPTTSTTPSSGFTGGYSAANLPSGATTGSSGSSFSTGAKASIPAWQRAMSKPAASSSTAAGGSSSTPGSGSSTPTASSAVKASEASTSTTA